MYLKSYYLLQQVFLFKDFEENFLLSLAYYLLVHFRLVQTLKGCQNTTLFSPVSSNTFDKYRFICFQRKR